MINPIAPQNPLQNTARASVPSAPPEGDTVRLGERPVVWRATRSQIGALKRGLADVHGNRDGIPDNETSSAGTIPSFIETQPALYRLTASLSVGLSTRKDRAELEKFLAESEKKWGEPVTNLSEGELASDAAFKVEKALALQRFDRKPSDVVDGWVAARGSVDGHEIAPRDIFIQRWKPIGPPSGKIVVLNPGYAETGRYFYEQVQILNREGADVILLDPQWAGYTESPPGKIDRGFGVARDIAAVAAHARQIADSEYGSIPGHQVILSGNSMGGGPGAIGALTMNDNGLIHLEGAQMPKGLAAMVESPYFATSHSVLNSILTACARIPLLRDLPLKATGLPLITTDPRVKAKNAQHAALDDRRSRFQAFVASSPDLQRVRELIASGHGPTGRVFVVQGKRDMLADPEVTRELVQQMGPNAHLLSVDTANHPFEEDPSYQSLLAEGLRWASGERTAVQPTSLAP